MSAPEVNAGFVAAMEGVLETRQRPRDPNRPFLCLDETSKQLIAEARAPIPPKPGQPARHDYEYQRNGVANLVMIFAPLEGWAPHGRDRPLHCRPLRESPPRFLRRAFPRRRKIVVVQDNLSRHTPASRYTTFPGPEASPRQPVRMAYAKAGSSVDMPESELAVLTTQRLSRSIPEKSTPSRKKSRASESHRNKRHAKADWQFTTETPVSN